MKTDVLAERWKMGSKDEIDRLLFQVGIWRHRDQS